jgi:Domain of unknown function (DUF4129)
MPKAKRQKTLADYVVIAISPLLIMTLVGSLVFFLLQLTYHGEYEGRLKWILFWFISAAVLVARIAIEQGKEYASLFGLALTAAVAVAAVRLVDQFLLAWVLLAVCWWCTWKLTFDCTLIDDNEDASGEGLLQAAGFREESPPASTSAGDDPAAQQIDTAPIDTAQADTDPPPGNRPVHAPGKWLVYFSLAALPIFGIGQMFIPSRDTEGRTYGFSLLALYVASALGLLLTTSFLGLRRYLRQRKLQMPARMTRAWLVTGTVIALALLCLALLLPQPQGEYSVTALVDKIDNKLRNASRFAVVGGDRAKGEGRRIGQQDPDEKKAGDAPPPDRKAQDQEKRDGQRNEQDGGDQKGKSKDGGPGEKKSDKGEAQEKEQGEKGGGQKERGDRQQKDSEEKRAAEKRPGGNPPKTAERERNRSSSPPPTSSGSAIGKLMQFLASLFKWVVYAAIAIAAFILARRHWAQIREALARLWAELLNLFGRRKETTQTASAGTVSPLAELPFSAYQNPFFSGAAGRMSPAQLVRYTFEALEAWSREQVVARRADQTPLEFAQELARRDPALGKDVTSAAELYVRVAYARRNPSRESVDSLERLWRRMGMGAGVA